jgi:hypothetical protein
VGFCEEAQHSFVGRRLQVKFSTFCFDAIVEKIEEYGFTPQLELVPLTSFMCLMI